MEISPNKKFMVICTKFKYCLRHCSHRFAHEFYSACRGACPGASPLQKIIKSEGRCLPIKYKGK
jgi:hypothetical protein